MLSSMCSMNQCKSTTVIVIVVDASSSIRKRKKKMMYSSFTIRVRVSFCGKMAIKGISKTKEPTFYEKNMILPKFIIYFYNIF